jgi:hypothetical protein
LRITAVDIIPVAVPCKPEAGTVVAAGLQLTEARHLLVEGRPTKASSASA